VPAEQNGDEAIAAADRFASSQSDQHQSLKQLQPVSTKEHENGWHEV
jgi:hypothetical protein